MVIRSAFAVGLFALACAEPPPLRAVVVVPEPEREVADISEPPARGLPSPEPVEEIDRRCASLASGVDARAAWMNPNMLRLELGTPPDGVTYSETEPTNLVGATLRGKTLTRAGAVMFLDLSTFRIGVLANVPLTCNGATKRIRVMVMPNSGKLQYGTEFHVVRRDVP